jgi:hypothetical protein
MIDATAAYPSAEAYLAHELAWLDAALLAELERFDRDAPAERGQGLFLSRTEIEPPPRHRSEPAAAAPRPARRPVTERRAAMEREPPLAALVRLFGLSTLEEVVVLLCLAAEIDPRYGRTYAYLHDDLNRRLPTLGLARRLIGPAEDEPPERAILLADASALTRWSLVEWVPEATPGYRLEREVRLDPRILGFLLGLDDEDFGLRGILRRAPRHDSAADPPLETPHGDLVEPLAALVRGEGRARGGAFVVFTGSGAADGRRLAERACGAAGYPLLEADGPRLLATGGGDLDRTAELLRRTARDARLRAAAVYLTGLDDLPAGEPGRSLLEALGEAWRDASVVGFADHRRALLPPDGLPALLAIELDLPAPAVRAAAWRAHLTRAGAAVSEGEVDDLALRFRFGFAEIHRAVRIAAGSADLRVDVAPAAIGRDDLVRASRALAGADAGPLARLWRPRAHWSDLVLPPAVLEHLREIAAQMRNRTTVLELWRFDRRPGPAGGLHALFTGSSGTGKTLAAEVLAGELDLDLLRVDLAGVVSKYIGETEKNLDRVFRGAERADALLFFDEADALFGKRSEVKDAHDRYANLEVNYLLQRLEEYDGLVVLASNLPQNIDDAFTRRMRFILDFPVPDAPARRRLWKLHLPEAAPLEPDVDLDVLADHYSITGGSIRTLLLNAAFLAAEEDTPIGSRHLLHAARREYEKTGKLYPGDPPEARPSGRPATPTGDRR